MRVAFVVRDYLGPGIPAGLSRELAARLPDPYRITVLTTPGTGRDGEAPPAAAGAREKVVECAGPDGDDSPAGYLREQGRAYDLVVLFDAADPAVLQVARQAGPPTVLIPFSTDDGFAGEDGAREVFERAGAFLFGSEAEERRLLARYDLHRRMRETIAAEVLLPRPANPSSGFRRDVGLRESWLVYAGPSDVGQGLSDLVRFFCMFRDSHPAARLDLLVLGRPTLVLPKRPFIRTHAPGSPEERSEALAGALMTVIPNCHAGFTGPAAESFSVGVPILVSTASELVDTCLESNGGLFYRSADELDVILEMGLEDPGLFARLGRSGREYLMARHGWDSVAPLFDRAFTSFARPRRPGASARLGTEAAAPTAAVGGTPAEVESAPLPGRSLTDEAEAGGARESEPAPAQRAPDAGESGPPEPSDAEEDDVAAAGILEDDREGDDPTDSDEADGPTGDGEVEETVRAAEADGEEDATDGEEDQAGEKPVLSGFFGRGIRDS